MLVRAMGVTPLWKDSTVFCIVGPPVPVQDDLKVCSGSVTSYRVISLFQAQSAIYLCGIVDGKLSVVVDPRRRAWARQEGGGKREEAMATRGELYRETG